MSDQRDLTLEIQRLVESLGSTLTAIAALQAAPPLHASTHQNGGTDEVATATPAANSIPKSGGAGQIDSGWVADATTISKGVIKIGTGALHACAGNDSRLSDARTPTGSAGGALGGTYPNPSVGAIPGRLLTVRVLTSGAGATYTPTAGTTSILVECVGGGASGGGAANTAANAAAGGAGGSGGYARKWYATIAASYEYTVGTGGSAGTAGNNPGNNGNNTVFDSTGSPVTAKAGAAGSGSAATTTPTTVAGGAGAAVSTGGDVNGAGGSGLPGIILSGTAAVSGQGGSIAPFGGGGAACTTERNGIAGVGYGAGGSGGVSYGTNAKTGGAGKDGVIVIWEFGS